MVEIKKDSKYSISFIFDTDDIRIFLQAFQYVLNNEHKIEINNIKIDKRIFYSKQKGWVITKLFIKKGKSCLYEHNNNYILELDEDDLEYGIELLENNIKLGYFEVAEFVKIKLPNINKLIDIYFFQNTI